jgi:large subunit ribosomal protein L35
MPKMKTHKGLMKRIRVTATGKIKYKQPNAGHLMSSKGGKRRRRLHKPGVLKSTFVARLTRALAGAKP